MWQQFDQFSNEVPKLLALTPTHPHEGYARDEFLRFVTIAGTLRTSFPVPIGASDERAISHVLIRSLLESFFWVRYIFESQNLVDRQTRFQRQLDEFQRQYAKMHNDPHLPYKNQIPAPQPNWINHPTAPDAASILRMQKNITGQRLDSLYFTYGVSSFDTHGRAAPELFAQSFGQANPQFHFLQIEPAIETAADMYIAIWNGGNF